jgi:hypothetical protein
LLTAFSPLTSIYSFLLNRGIRSSIDRAGLLDRIYMLAVTYDEYKYFASISGRKDVRCFRNMAARVLNDK